MPFVGAGRLFSGREIRSEHMAGIRLLRARKSNIGSAGHVSYVPDIRTGGGINAAMDRVFISEGKP